MPRSMSQWWLQKDAPKPVFSVASQARPQGFTLSASGGALAAGLRAIGHPTEDAPPSGRRLDPSHDPSLQKILHDIEVVLAQLLKAGNFDVSASNVIMKGVQDGLSGLAVGASAGPYGAIIGAIVGVCIGISDGLFGTSRSGFSDKLEAVIEGLAPIERYVFLTGMRDFSTYVRAGENKVPLGPWVLCDRDDITITGSRQIIVAWALEHCWDRDCMLDLDGFVNGPKGIPASSPLASVAQYEANLQQLPDLTMWALAFGASNQVDPSNFPTDEHMIRDSKDGNHQVWLSQWLQSHQGYTAQDYRDEILARGFPDVTRQVWRQQHIDALQAARAARGV